VHTVVGGEHVDLDGVVVGEEVARGIQAGNTRGVGRQVGCEALVDGQAQEVLVHAHLNNNKQVMNVASKMNGKSNNKFMSNQCHVRRTMTRSLEVEDCGAQHHSWQGKARQGKANVNVSATEKFSSQ
jgi:hypothetical protein